MNCSNRRKVSTGEIARRIDAELAGSDSIEIYGINSIDEASENEITFLSGQKHLEKVKQTKAAGIIVKDKIADFDGCQFIVDNVDASLIAAMHLFAPETTVFDGVHPTAVIEDSAEIGENVRIGPGVYVSHGARVGSNTVIGAGCKIGQNSTIGQNSQIDCNVVIYRNCHIGDSCIIQANSTIGACGFGYSFIEGAHRLIPHNGGVVIEDHVEIGANCCIDRAKFGNTVIGSGTKIDDLVMVAHNVVVGRSCLFAAQVGIAGSTIIGDGVVMGGRSGIGDHRKIGDGVKIGAVSTVLKDFPPNTDLMGSPAVEMNQNIRQLIHVQRLPRTEKTLKDLVKRVKKLEASKDD